MDRNDKLMFTHISHGRNEIFLWSELLLSTVSLYSPHWHFPVFIHLGKSLLGAGRGGSTRSWRGAGGNEFLQQRAAAKNKGHWQRPEGQRLTGESTE